MRSHIPLNRYLDGLYTRYDKRFLRSDPVQFPHAYSDPLDQEIVALLAALFAFGNVTSIHASVRKILAPMGSSPRCFVETLQPSAVTAIYRGFVHRWVTARDLVALLCGIQKILTRWGSLRACFLAHYDPAAPDIGEALSAFSARLAATVGSQSRGLRFLFNDPARGAACKRLNMFLRWVVRPTDGIDLGLWPAVRPSQLIIPVDTHIARISRFIGLTDRKTVNWAMAQEITHRLRDLAPDDPVKYDFALSRIGIVEGCRGYRHARTCPTCPLDPVCKAPSKNPVVGIKAVQ